MLSNKLEKSSYLETGRLGEVLALIQVLAYDKDTVRREKGIADELQSTPFSADSWIELAECHPEFFRVRARGGEGEKRAALIARYLLPYEHTDNDKDKRPRLDSSAVNQLMQIAIELHDRQVNRKQQWKLRMPLIVAIITAAAAIVAAVIKQLLNN